MSFYDARHDGAPDVAILKSKVVTARKVHICDQCNAPIEPGTRYQSVAGTEDGKFFIQRSHFPRCPHEPTPCRSCGATGLVLMEHDDRRKTQEYPCPHCSGSGYFD